MLKKLETLYANTKMAKFKFFLTAYTISSFFTMGYFLHYQYITGESLNPILAWFNAFTIPLFFPLFLLLYALLLAHYFIYFFAYFFIYYFLFKISKQMPYFKITTLAISLSAFNIFAINWFDKTRPII